jgi:hypothetical protein
MQILARAINEVVWRCVGNSHGSIGLNSLQEPRAPPGMLAAGASKERKNDHAAVRTTVTALGTRNDLCLKSWYLLRIMRMPFISRLSVMKTNPEAESSLDQEHNVRRKTFIWLPFIGGLSVFAVILPQPIEGRANW